MTILFLESGTDATHTFIFYIGVSGTVSSSTAQANTGLRSISIAAGAAFTNAVRIPWGTPRRLSLHMRFGATPGANAVLLLFSTGTGGYLYLGRNTSGNLFLAIDGGATIATGTATLGNDTWIHLVFAWIRTSLSVNEFRVWVNGTIDLTATDFSTWSDPVNNTIYIQAGNNTGAVSFLDDVFQDDDSSLTTLPDIRVTAKLPATANTSGFDTDVGTGAVNERPLSVTNGKQHAGLTDVQENYTLQAASVGDVDLTGATIVGYTGWVWAKRGT